MGRDGVSAQGRAPALAAALAVAGRVSHLMQGSPALDQLLGGTSADAVVQCCAVLLRYLCNAEAEDRGALLRHPALPAVAHTLLPQLLLLLRGRMLHHCATLERLLAYAARLHLHSPALQRALLAALEACVEAEVQELKAGGAAAGAQSSGGASAAELARGAEEGGEAPAGVRG